MICGEFVVCLLPTTVKMPGEQVLYLAPGAVIAGPSAVQRVWHLINAH